MMQMRLFNFYKYIKSRIFIFTIGWPTNNKITIEEDMPSSVAVSRRDTVGKRGLNLRMHSIGTVWKYIRNLKRNMILSNHLCQGNEIRNGLWLNIKIMKFIWWLNNSDRVLTYSGNGITRFLRKQLISGSLWTTIKKGGKISLKILIEYSLYD